VQDPETGATLASNRNFGHYLDVLQGGWERLFGELKARADQVYVVGNTPKLPRETGVCLSGGDPDLGDCAFAPGPQARSEAKASFAAAQAADVGVVNAAKWFCAEQVCPSVVGHFITMRDSEHMTPDYARWLAPALAVALGLAPADSLQGAPEAGASGSAGAGGSSSP
jgi:hypothetical protein